MAGIYLTTHEPGLAQWGSADTDSGSAFYFGNSDGTFATGKWDAEALWEATSSYDVKIASGKTKSLIGGETRGYSSLESANFGDLSNAGTFSVTGAGTKVTFTNRVNEDDFIFNTANGTITIDTGASIVFETEHGKRTNAGLINVNGGTLELKAIGSNSVTFKNTGTITVAGGILDVSNKYLEESSSFGNISLDQASTLKWASAASLLNAATLTLNLDGTVTAPRKLIDFTGTGTVDYSAAVDDWSTKRALLRRADDDLWYTVSALTTDFINGDGWTGSPATGAAVATGAYYKLNAFDTVTAALAAPDADLVTTLDISGSGAGAFGTASLSFNAAGLALVLNTSAEDYTITNAGDTTFKGGSLAKLSAASNKALTLEADGVDEIDGFATTTVAGDVTAKAWTVGDLTVNTGKTLTVNKDSLLVVSGLALNGTGALALSTAGSRTYGKVIDFTGTYSGTDPLYAAATGNTDGFTEYNNDLYIGEFTLETLYVNSTYSGADGTAIENAGIIGFNAFASTSAAADTAASPEVAYLDVAGDKVYNRTRLYVNSGYTGDFGTAVTGNANAMVGFNAFDAIADATAVASANSVLEVTGGTLSGNNYANGKTLEITGSVAGSGAYVYGGLVDGASVGDVTVGAAVDLKAVIGGSTVDESDSDLETAKATSVTFADGAANSTAVLVAGGNKVTDDATIANNTSVTLSDDVTVTGYTVGGSFQTGTTAVTVGGSSSLTIAAGTYGALDTTTGAVTGVVTGGGFLQNSANASNGAYTQTGNVNITVTGGAINTVLLGAGAARKATNGQMTLNGNVNITIGSATNDIYLYEVYAGFNGAGTINGDTTMTFTGNGAKLHFNTVTDKTYNGVFGDNAAGAAGVASGYTRTLAFNGFTGDFTANNIKKFDKIKLADSTVTFTQSGLNLSPVKTWEFTGTTSLTWTGTGEFYANNSFAGDTLVFSAATAPTSQNPWIVMTGNDDTLSGWDQAAKVSLFGEETTEFDSDANAWVTDTYKLKRDGGNLVVTLA